MALLQQALILHRQGRLEEAASLYRKMLCVALMETDVHERDNRGTPINGLIAGLRRDAAS